MKGESHEGDVATGGVISARHVLSWKRQRWLGPGRRGLIESSDSSRISLSSATTNSYYPDNER